MRIVIAGAGLGGVAAAAGLVRAGHDVVVCERADEVREAGTGVAIMPNGVLALDALGVSGFVREQARRQPMSGGFCDHRGRRLLVTDEVAVERMQRDLGAPTAIVARPPLHRALRAPLPPGVVRTGMPVLGLDHGADTVEVHCPGTTLRADVLVVADGIASTLRAALFPDHPGPARAGRLDLRGMLTPPADLDLGTVSNGLLTDHHSGIIFGCFPMADGRVYWFTDSAHDAVDGGLSDAAEARSGVLAEMSDWHPVVTALIVATPPEAIHIDASAHLARPLGSFAVGRVALLGDAAHAMTPDLGQGANQAFEDAAELTRQLDGAGADDVVERLRSYDARRRPRANRLLRESTRMSRMMTVTGLPARLRNLVMRAIPGRFAAGAMYRMMRAGG